MNIATLETKVDQIIIDLQILNSCLQKYSGQGSTELNELFAALAKAQLEMEFAGLRTLNPYFKTRYADLAEIVRASRPSLAKNGLCVLQQIINNSEGQTILNTILAHSSGQWIASQMKIIPPKSDVQTLGSYITYLRRYSYAALVGIVASDEDDDAEKVVATEREIFAKGPAQNKIELKSEGYETVSADQLEQLEFELKGFPDIAEEVLNKLQLQSLANMPKSRFNPSLSRIREIKLIRNTIK